jgi:hypothetical protein
MIAPNFEVKMLNHIWRLVGGAVLGILNIGVVLNYLGAGSGELWGQVELFLLLALWALTTGATLGTLIYYDLRQSLRQPRIDLTGGEIRDNELRSDNSV